MQRPGNDDKIKELVLESGVKMLRDRWTNEQIESWLDRIEQGKESFKEGVAWEILDQLEHIENDRSKQYRSKLLSRLAYSRFLRIHKVDHLVERWMSEALKEDQENVLAHQLYVEAFWAFLNQVPIPDKFPPIRETDHGSAKKKTASEYNQMAETFFLYINEYEKQKSLLHSSVRYLENTTRVQDINHVISFIEELRKPFTIILTATGDYLDSLQGVYHSASQFKEIVNATKMIEQIMMSWSTKFPSETMKSNVTALEELANMVGLKEVKSRVNQLYHFLNYEKERIRQGFHTKDGMNLHLILTGNPGTGKTHLARLMAKIYFELGLLERDEVYEVDRSQLVGAYVGQTEENTNQAIERAMGGVLFIDEAYSLKRDGAAGNDYGQTAIDTLVSAMTSGKYAGTFAVILAGYPEEMRTFLRSNPGLRSRFPDQNQLEMANYSIDELLDIAEKVALENDYLLTTDAKRECRKRIENAQVDESFGNARTVKNIILDAIFKKGANMSLDQSETEDFVFLQADDFKEEKEVSSKEQKASKQLHQLIGLEQVKKEMMQLTSFVEIQQLRREKGLQTLPLQVHSVFTGNPGTGKTTVAKLYATLLKEIGLLKRGHLIVVSRADLVAGYVGQTAQKTKEKIRDALGGVLFIDEAYSLLANSQEDFGKEVINTLVQEMTEHEENLVVVLAGYSSEIERLLNSNPGLRSRFKKHIHFANYSKMELVQIIQSRGERTGYYFTDSAKDALITLLPDEGHVSNGRYAMDLFDQLVQIQSIRLSKHDQIESEQLAIIEDRDVQEVLSENE